MLGAYYNVLQLDVQHLQQHFLLVKHVQHCVLLMLTQQISTCCLEQNVMFGAEYDVL